MLDKLKPYFVKRNFLEYLILIVGIVTIITAIEVLFTADANRDYKIFFGNEVSKMTYILYRLILGAVFLFSFFNRKK